MSTKHTPGPWAHNGIHFGIPTPSGSVCNINIGRFHKRPEAISNARLIAAAPELLEALRHIVALADACSPGELWSPSSGLVNEARAAISKATGEKT